MLNEVQKEHQDDHNIPMKNKKKKKKTLNLSSYQTLKIKTHPFQMKINGEKIRRSNSFPSLLFFIRMREYSCGKGFRIADDGVSTLQRSAVLQAGF